MFFTSLFSNCCIGAKKKSQQQHFSLQVSDIESKIAALNAVGKKKVSSLFSLPKISTCVSNRDKQSNPNFLVYKQLMGNFLFCLYENRLVEFL